MKKRALTLDLILNLLPSEPDNYTGYEVTEYSARWFAVWLCHPDYDYKQGVRTIHSFINKKGECYAPLHVKPSNTFVCSVYDLYKQNPYTLIKTKPNPLLKYL